jgi:transcriptional regulator with XRE-family HTH domain
MDRRQKELAQFLRSRRERLKPAAAGLPSGRRRRTPGLRREEVAELAGIGTGWYTFLEQGRDVRPSEGALRRIAGALQLDRAEKKYLLDLALECVPSSRGDEVVPPVLRRVVRSTTGPALILGQRWDLLDWNEGANAVWDLDYIRDRNVLRSCFTPEARALYPNWACRARQLVTVFRALNAARLRDPWILSVVDGLRERSSDFRVFWAEQSVSEENSGHVTLDHPFVGRLQFNFAILSPRDNPSLGVDVFSCDGDETSNRLRELIRQLREGERGPMHNVWTALAPGTRA